MKAHSYFLRTLLLSAVGGGLWACSSDVETCDSCADPSGDGDGDGSLGDGDGDAGDGDGDAGDGDGDGDGDEAAPTCTNPEVVDDPRGLVACDEGYSHRPASPECPNILPRDEVIEFPTAEPGGVGGAGEEPYTVSTDECSTDSDCGELEYCVVIQTNIVPGLCGGQLPQEESLPDYARICQSAGSGCVTDADCEADQYCLCGAFAGTCATPYSIAGCRTDADCEGEAMCLANARADAEYMYFSLACQLDGDECDSDGDCAADDFCLLTADSGRACQPQNLVVCGRPFLVFGDCRLASLERNSNWPTDVRAATVPEDDSIRQALASHFSRVGLMEHASIAAFARFTLQLLSLGAPAEFIEASNSAQVDETRHARLAFTLASAYAGESMGPGALSLDRVLEEASWERIFEATVREGCIGETRAALEAKWAAESCRDPVVRAVLEGIARDETAHAELAWRVAVWMIGQRPELLGAVERIFGEATVPPADDDARLDNGAVFGVLSNDELKACWKDAWNEIITPCARAVLRAPSAASASAALLKKAPTSAVSI